MEQHASTQGASVANGLTDKAVTVEDVGQDKALTEADRDPGIAEDQSENVPPSAAGEVQAATVITAAAADQDNDPSSTVSEVSPLSKTRSS